MKNQLLLKTTLLCVCVMLLAAGCTPKNKPISANGFYFDTVIGITLYDAAKQYALDHCMEMAADYEAWLSDALPDSDVSMINTHPNEAVKVHPETAELIASGLSYGKLSDGRFDITIGRLAKLWAFEKEIIPDESSINQSKKAVDYRNVTVDGDLVTLGSRDSAIDLGGIAKGYIADKMKAYLVKEGVNSGLINLGGNVLAIGTKPDGSDFTIGIQKPFSDDATPAVAVEIADSSVVTSGTYQRYFQKDGRIYHHILDKETGFPCENGLASVTILSPSSVEGDALSTAVFLMGADAGMKFVEKQSDVEAVFITTEGDILYSSGFGEKIRYKEY